jgi:hypothetical protein
MFRSSFLFARQRSRDRNRRRAMGDAGPQAQEPETDRALALRAPIACHDADSN